MKGNLHIEKKLIECITDNKEAFYRLAYSYVKNENDAVDILQDSIQKAISSKRHIKNEQYIKSWFYRIVVNTSLDFLKKQKTQKQNAMLILLKNRDSFGTITTASMPGKRFSATEQ